MPIDNYIVATEPLGAGRARGAHPRRRGGRGLALRRQLLPADRPTAGCSSAAARATAGASRATSPGWCGRGCSAVYPAARATSRIDYAWGGTLAITVNRMPAFRRLAADVFSAGGYSGQGVALATLAGKLMAEAVAGHRRALRPASPRCRSPASPAARRCAGRCWCWHDAGTRCATGSERSGAAGAAHQAGVGDGAGDRADHPAEVVRRQDAGRAACRAPSRWR